MLSIKPRPNLAANRTPAGVAAQSKPLRRFPRSLGPHQSRLADCNGDSAWQISFWCTELGRVPGAGGRSYRRCGVPVTALSQFL